MKPPNHSKRFSAVSHILCLIIFACSSFIIAVETPHPLKKEYNVRAWKGADGLPQHTITSIVQTPDGYIWFSTYGGLVRFDGIKFHVFGETEGINSKQIVKLFLSSDGTLWIETLNKPIFRYKDGKFKPLQNENGTPYQNVRHYYEDRQGNVWIATGNGVVRWKNETVTKYENSDQGAFGHVNSVLESRTGEIWLGTLSGLVKFDGQHFTRYGFEQFTGHSVSKKPEDINAVTALIEDGDGNLWVGTSYGLYRFKDGNSSSVKIGSESSSNNIKNLFQDKDGNIWVGTDNGLYSFKDGNFNVYKTNEDTPIKDINQIFQDKSGTLWIGTLTGLLQLVNDRFIRYTSSDGLPSDRIFCIFQGKEGNLWIGTHNGGLARIGKGIIKSYSQENGFPARNMIPILEDNQKNLWFGAYCGGLIRLTDGKFTLYNEQNGFINNACLMGLRQDRAGNLWIGTENSGLYRFRDGKFTQYLLENGKAIDVTVILEDRSGTIWVGSNNAGLYSFKNGVFTNYTLRDGLVNDGIHFLGEDTSGNLLIGTVSGISRLIDGKFINWTPKDGLPDAMVRDIIADPDGTLWIATYGGGLSRFKNGKFLNFTTKEGLFEDIVSRILEDDNGHFWTSGNRGIASVSRKDLNDFADGKISKVTSISYEISDGMHIGETNGNGQPAGYKSADGLLWFPTIDGVVAVNPKLTNKVIPPVFIEEMTVDGNQIDLSPGIELAADSINLEIKYTALSYTAPEKIKFKYQLEGYDKEWINVDGRRTAYFSSLPPGNYNFRVIACNNDGVWNETGAVIQFTKKPFFYQTYTFYLLSAMIIGLLVLAIYRFRVRKLEQKQKELEKRQIELTGIIEERTQAQTALLEKHHQLEETLEQLDTAQKHIIEQERLRALGQMASGVAHDFNNALAPILGYTELLLRYPVKYGITEPAVRNLNFIHTAATDAAKIVTHLRAFYRLSGKGEKFLRVNVSLLIDQTISLSQPKWKAQSQSKGATIKTKTDLEEDLFTACDESEIREVLINLIFNAADAMPQGGTITLRAYAKDKNVIIEVTDTGIGMSEETRRKCLEPFFTTKGDHGTGLGLAMVYGVIQRHRGTIEIESELGKGATFRMMLPVWMDEKEEEEEMEKEEPIEKSLSILLVDDEIPILNLFSQILTLDGHTVETASDGEEGLNKFKSGKFDLVITDNAMPNMSGIQMTEAIKQINSQISIILMTGFGEIMKENGEKPLHIDEILVKPVPIEKLLAAIRQLFEKEG